MANFYGSYIGFGAGGAGVGLVGGWQGDRGLNSGGHNQAGGGMNTIQYITVSVLGNSTDFGNLTRSTHSPGTCSSGTRSVCGGGNAGAAIDYVTIATTGDSQAFGNLLTGRYLLTATSSVTRGIWIGGHSPTNLIDYVTLATTGDAADFGDYGNGGFGIGSCSDGSRFVGAGGYAENTKMYYGDIATTGQTAQAFGDISTSWGWGCEMWSNTIRGVMNYGTKLHYITIATLGDSQNFGTHYSNTSEAGGLSNGTRGVCIGGNYNSTNNILYHDMSTLGDTAVFGSLVENTSDNTSACSGRPT